MGVTAGTWEWGEWSGSEGSQLQLAPTLPPSPLPPEVVGTPIHSKLFIGHWEWGPARWEWQQGLGSEGSDLGVRGASFSLLPPCLLTPCPQRWWGPKYILSYSLDIESEVQWGGSERSDGRKVRGVTGARLSLLPHYPLAPCTQELVGIQIHTKLFSGIWEWGQVSWEWGEWQQGLGSEGSHLQVRGASFSFLLPCSLAPYLPEVVGTPIHTKLFIAHWEWAGSI